MDFKQASTTSVPPVHPEPVPQVREAPPLSAPDGPKGNPRSKKRIMMFLALGFIFVLLLVIAFIFSKNYQQKSPQISQKPAPTSSHQQTSPTFTAPKVIFDKYESNTGVVNLPTASKKYSIKSNFSFEEALSFGNRLGLSDFEKNNKGWAVVYNMKDKDKRGILTFNLVNGSFNFRSYGELKVPDSSLNQSKTLQAQSFIKTLGFTDTTIACPVTYQRKDAPNVNFVECHRDWTKLGAPLINLFGVLNISENTKLSTLSPGTLDKNMPANSLIYQVSNGGDGKARPNDFNTITIGIYPDGTIHSVDSNLRWIAKENAIASNDLVSRDDAFTALENHKAEFSLNIPAGQGNFDWNLAYPDNTAHATKALIQDVSLAYVDKPLSASQDEYSPSYVIRGLAVLDSGYTVKFVQTIPAEKSKFSKIAKLPSGSIAGVSTSKLAQADSLQLGSFTPSPSRPVTPTPAPQVEQCLGEETSANVTLNVPGYGTAVVGNVQSSSASGDDGFGGGGRGDLRGGPHTFYLRSTSYTNPDISKIKEAFNKAVEDQYVIIVSQYLKANPATLNSTADVEAVFKKINGGSSEVGFAFNRPARPAPLKFPSNPDPKNGPDISKKVYKNVAQRVLDASKTDQIESIAAEADIFGSQTIRGLEETLVPKSNVKASDRPCYVSGGSPSIFLYPEKATSISVKTGADLTYSDPSVSNNTWNVTAYPDGRIDENGVERGNIYYEYDKSKVSFSEPKEGFVVETSQGLDFVKTLSGKLGLNTAETKAMLADAQRILSKTNKSYIKVSLLPRSELDKNLPLTINPAPVSLARIFLMITSLDSSENINPQKLTSVVRTGFTAVEVGAK